MSTERDIRGRKSSSHHQHEKYRQHAEQDRWHIRALHGRRGRLPLICIKKKETKLLLFNWKWTDTLPLKRWGKKCQQSPVAAISCARGSYFLHSRGRSHNPPRLRIKNYRSRVWMCCCYQRGQKAKYITGIAKMSKNKNSLYIVFASSTLLAGQKYIYCRASQTSSV